MRQATVEDIPRIVELGRAFHAASPWRDVAYDADATANTVAGAITGPGVVFLTENGMIGGIVSPLWFNPAVKVGIEMFWWAPTGGRALREAFEQWAKSEGATMIQFSALADENLERVDRIYSRSGFTRAETVYVKGLT